MLTSRIAKAMDKWSTYHTLFLDFAKAFDKVPHPVLLYHLGKFANQNALSWFSSCLGDRQFTVKVTSSVSTTRPIAAGVPQGSHLGPILFLLYINSLPQTIPDEDHCRVLLFADDTTIGTEVAAPTTPSSQHHSHPLQVATDAALKWADSAGGRFNPTKSFQMTFSPRINGPDPPNIGHLRMNQEEVRTVDTHRHLGVQIDSHLNFQCHIETITTKFRQRVVLLAHMSSRLTLEVTNRLYTGYVRPTIEYASPLWQFQLSASQAAVLERLQARLARVVLRQYGVFPSATEPKPSLFAHLQWPSLAWRRHIQCLRELHHLVHHQTTALMELGYSLSTSARRPLQLVPPARANSYSRATFLFVTAATWNSLPPLTLEPPKIVIALCLVSVPSLPTPTSNPLVSFLPEFL